MKRIAPLCIAFVLAIGFSACNGPSSKDDSSKRLITEIIEFPVFIKSPYGEEEGVYWKENLETSKRLDFVRTLFDWARNGKVKTYDYLTNQPLSPEQVKAIENKSDTVHIAQSFPPYDEIDTVIQSKVDLNLIHKLKFLEEWSFDEKKFLFETKLLGVAPALTVYGDSSDVLGYKPLFWIYFDEDYIRKLTEKK